MGSNLAVKVRYALGSRERRTEGPKPKARGYVMRIQGRFIREKDLPKGREGWVRLGEAAHCQQIKLLQAGNYAILTNGRVIMGKKTA
jgi:hypothetical protein